LIYFIVKGLVCYMCILYGSHKSFRNGKWAFHIQTFQLYTLKKQPKSSSKLPRCLIPKTEDSNAASMANQVTETL